MKSLLIVYSYHHRNTEKVAETISRVLDAPIKAPDTVTPMELSDYDCIGFGSGIYHARHHDSLLNLADQLPRVSLKPAFIFSTAAIIGEKKTRTDHDSLRKILESKGYVIIDEFSCKGFNTNSFLKFFGGMNKGRPDEEDLKKAEEFAMNLKSRVSPDTN